MSNITTLQSNLLQNAYRLLAPKGFLIYSTCTYSQLQNEDIIQQFLSLHPEAKTEPPFTPEQAKLIPFLPGKIPNTIKFEPCISNSGTIFMAKIRKPE